MTLQCAQQVGAASTNYALTIGGFSGQFTYDAFQGYSGYTFATADHPTGQTGGNCAAQNGGAWWYQTCACTACLTQSTGSTPFQWDLGFSVTNLITDSMTLVCK